METVNDLDGDLMTFWKVLREQPADLARVCALSPHSRAEHDASYGGLSGLDDLERARRVWVRLTQGRTGTMRKTGWRHYVRSCGGDVTPAIRPCSPTPVVRRRVRERAVSGHVDTGYLDGLHLEESQCIVVV